MRAHHADPLRGLLAGLLALVAFASFAVGMTAGGVGGSAAALTDQALIDPADGDGRRDRFRGDGARIAVARDGDRADRGGGRSRGFGGHRR